MPNSLTTTLTSAQCAISTQTQAATRSTSPLETRGVRMDRLLSSLSRHVYALEEVFVDEVKVHLGAAPARELGRDCHLVQLDTATLTRRLRGSAQTMRVPWRAIWADFQDHLSHLLDTEERLAAMLATQVADAELDDIAVRLCQAESCAPTRPHPHLPQRGVRGRLARRLVRRTDALWDGLQGRPDPVSTLVRINDEPTRAVRS